MEIEHNPVSGFFEVVDQDGEMPTLTGYRSHAEAIAARDELEQEHE